VNGEVWGRGTVDMKGLGVIHLYAFLELKRQRVPLSRDVIFMAVPDEEVGGAQGARSMIENHYAALDPEYVLDEGGFGSRDLFAKGKLVYGISVAEKKMLWLRITAEGVAGHGSQPHDRNPNDRLVRGLARLVAEPLPSGEFEVLAILRQKVGLLEPNKFTNAIQHSTISLTTMRAGVGEPPKVNVIPSVAEATLDCRVLPGVTKDASLGEIRRRLGDPALKIEVAYESEDPIVTSQATPLYRALVAAIERRHPDAIVSPILTRRSLVVLRFAAASCVVSVKITVAPSGDTWISPMSRTANTSSIVRGRGDRLWFRAFPAAPATMAVATTPMHAIAGTSHHARFFCLSCLPWRDTDSPRRHEGTKKRAAVTLPTSCLRGLVS
jgi:hypothetical protein